MSRFSREPDHATLPLVPMMEAADGTNFHGGSVSDPLDGPRVRRVSVGAYGQLGQTPGAHRCFDQGHARLQTAPRAGTASERTAASADERLMKRSSTAMRAGTRTSSPRSSGTSRGLQRHAYRFPIGAARRSRSRRMRGAPQSGFASRIRRIRTLRSDASAGRPMRRDREFHRPYAANARRCQRTTLAGVTICAACRQFGQTIESSTQSSRSSERTRGRVGAGRCSTAS